MSAPKTDALDKLRRVFSPMLDEKLKVLVDTQLQETQSLALVISRLNDKVENLESQFGKKLNNDLIVKNTRNIHMAIEALISRIDSLENKVMAQYKPPTNIRVNESGPSENMFKGDEIDIEFD